MSEEEIKTVPYNVNLYEKLHNFIYTYGWFPTLLIGLMIYYGTIEIETSNEREIKNFIFRCKRCSLNVHVHTDSVFVKSMQILKHLKIDEIHGLSKKLSPSLTTCAYDLEEYVEDIMGLLCEFEEVDIEYTDIVYENIKIIGTYNLNPCVEDNLICMLQEKYSVFMLCNNCGLYIKSEDYEYYTEIFNFHAINHIIEAINKVNITCGENE